MPHYIKGAYSWGICGEDTPAHHIMSREAPGAWVLGYSKECPIQQDFQCRSQLESIPPLAAVQCTVTMRSHKPGTPGCLIRLITCVWNLGFQPEKGAMLLHSKHVRETHGGMGCETRPTETKCLRLDRSTVFTGAADYIFLLQVKEYVYLYT